MAVDEGTARADLTVEENPTQAVKPGEESQPVPEESLDIESVTVPSGPAIKPGTSHSQQQKERTVRSKPTGGSQDLEGLSPAGDTTTVKPVSQKRNEASGCLTRIALLLLGAFFSGGGLAYLSSAQDNDANEKSQSTLTMVQAAVPDREN
ncbi:MAG: hypothetical protein F4047_00385 [Caldilineaceae bacterium SB0670_bin_27]|uniref:Uncharacterized protein n=1 Tax=Caldilineaceae bacterium SB0664_bin_27 TaxID=2605260 RepID=A0A6B0YR45_9CHLR|nr:hypothetical protein [Caldilineaceae bacterium SB0664_bin_27]MYJ76643.1 hypothetical protein [Caldilineaceae bacterium SB0670_bin_27]